MSFKIRVICPSDLPNRVISIERWQFHFLTAVQYSVLVCIKIIWIWSFAIISVMNCCPWISNIEHKFFKIFLKLSYMLIHLCHHIDIKSWKVKGSQVIVRTSSITSHPSPKHLDKLVGTCLCFLFLQFWQLFIYMYYVSIVPSLLIHTVKSFTFEVLIRRLNKPFERI